MKKIMMALVLLMSMSASWAEYNVGDIAVSNSWQDSPSGSTLISRTMQGFVDNKIVLVMTWGYLG